MGLKKLRGLFEKYPNLKWFNIFVRDTALIFVMLWVNWLSNWGSWWAGFTLGALVVLVCWHYDDYRREKRLREVKL